jgi:probable phosphoglycerate mutase
MRTSPAALRLYFIRHGETEWSLTSKHTSRTEISLSEREEHEARALKARLQAVQFTHIYSSPSLRARQTCALTLSVPSAEVEIRLREWDYGDYEGRRSADIRMDRPQWNLFQDGCPHGESPAQVSSRADQLIAYLRMLAGNIALYSHGQFGSVFAARWIGLSVLAAQHFQLGAASLSILGYSPNHGEVPVIFTLGARSGTEAGFMGLNA